MSIQALPDNVISQIKSSTTITTLNSAVCGLLRNSLDAGASKVIISIDYIRGSCSVEDDGLGILPTEFKATGGLGRLHFTSKYPVNKDIHGKHGVFLASLASLSLLFITSHHHKHHTHNSIQIHNSDVLARHIPSPPDQRLLSFPHGTRVVVRDLFGSMPVRVKQRAIDAERGVHSKHWEQLKRDISALLLAWDGCVSVSAREPTNRWALSVCSRRVHRDSEDAGPSLTAKVSGVLHQTGFSDENKPEAWVPLRASAGEVSVSGAVSLHPTVTKRNQFISIGIHPLPNDYGYNILYEEINRVFSNSSYGIEEGDASMCQEHDTREKDRYNRTDGFTTQELKGRKGADRWPMFFIKIHIDESADYIAYKDMDELLDERHGNVAAMVDILKAVAYEFLKKYRFRPSRIRGTKHDISGKSSRSNSPETGSSGRYGSISTLATRTCKKRVVGDLATTQLRVRSDQRSRSRPDSPFDLWSRIKVGSPQQVLEDKKADEKFTDEQYQVQQSPEETTPNPSTNVSNTTTPFFDADGKLLRAPFPTTDPVIGGEVNQEHQCIVETGRMNEDLRWTNPITKDTLIIDSRTGFIQSPKVGLGEERERASSMHHRWFPSHNNLTPNADRSAWLGDLLSSWENPVFKTTEPSIPATLSEGNSSARLIRSSGCGAWLQGPPEVGPPTQGRVSKAALQKAEVLAQVDRKFVLARVLADPYTYDPTATCSRASLLIIIDQHAADERCRVESLMADYFESVDGQDGAKTLSAFPVACSELLERPLQFDISVRDATQLEHTATHFARWGIHYRVTPLGSGGYRHVEVTKLPPSIAERCRLEPRLLAELLRKESWKVDEPDHYSTLAKEPTQDGGTTTTHWSTRFYGCPQGILDMINSRACRSSIMFNDPLSKEECANLVKRLADCAFPFQCAHGRPSMVPLIDLGDSSAHIINEERSSNPFGKAFRAWNSER